jgi:hypothetical protein
MKVREHYKKHVEAMNPKSVLCKLHESDFIRAIDLRLSSLKALKRSFLDLQKACKYDDEKQFIDDQIAQINEKLDVGAIAADVLPQGNDLARPNEKPERKKGKRYGFTDPFTPPALELLPFAPAKGQRDLSRPSVDLSQRRAVRVHVMRTWQSIRDRPTFVRPKDIQPVPAEGAMSQMFDSLALKSRALLAAKSASLNRRSGVAQPSNQPVPSYFQFSDFANTAEVVAPAPFSVLSQHILTPIQHTFSAAPDETSVDDEVPEDAMPTEANDREAPLQVPSALWVVSEGDQGIVREEAPAEHGSSKLWSDSAKYLIRTELTKYLKGVGGREKLVSSSHFSQYAKKIYTHICSLRREIMLKDVFIDFTTEDQNKVKKEVEKFVSALTREKKRVRAAENF